MESLVQELQNIRLEMTELKKKIELKEEDEVLMEEGDGEDLEMKIGIKRGRTDRSRGTKSSTQPPLLPLPLSPSASVIC